MNWYILRIYAGFPLKVEHTIRDMGIPAFCPAQTIKRRHPRGKELITQRKPLLPGYVFSPEHFDVQAINTTRTKARWLVFAGRIATLNQDGIEALRQSESQWRPDLFDLAHVLNEIAKGVPVRKHRFIRFEEFRKGMVAA